jgi:hypothetical protein
MGVAWILGEREKTVQCAIKSCMTTDVISSSTRDRPPSPHHLRRARPSEKRGKEPKTLKGVDARSKWLWVGWGVAADSHMN